MIAPISPQGPLTGLPIGELQPAVAPQNQTVAAPAETERSDTDNKTGNGDKQDPREQREADARKREVPQDDRSLARSVVEGKLEEQTEEESGPTLTLNPDDNREAKAKQLAEAAFVQAREIQQQQQDKAVTAMRERL
ncbi:hypothetical protein ACJ5NV_14070 [Loktanella agnita]|uniref:hypothetical protein n=1 Tax=Loktanella agnita TaxID=287097 RepID=UPI003987F8C8